MFQFPTFAFHNNVEWYALRVPGCPIRIPADRFVFANPRGFSQLITSFVAFQSLGIPHVPLFTFISPSGLSLRRAGYDKYTLASLIFYGLPYCHWGQICTCRGGNAIFQWTLFILIFALVLFHHVKDLFFNCQPLPSLRSSGQSIVVWRGIEPLFQLKMENWKWLYDSFSVSKGFPFSTFVSPTDFKHHYFFILRQARLPSASLIHSLRNL